MTVAGHKAVYFGCIGRVGHYFTLPNGTSPKYDKPEDVVPWGYGVEKLTPTADKTQGAAAIHHKDGWTALAVHDYTVDSRGNSKSVFCFNADLSADELLFSVVEFFPKIEARVGEIRIVEVNE